MRTNNADLDEVAQDEPSHHDLCCLQIQLFSSLVYLKVFSCDGQGAARQAILYAVSVCGGFNIGASISVSIVIVVSFGVGVSKMLKFCF